MNLHKIFKIVAALLSLVGAVLLILIISAGDEAIDAAYIAGEDTSSVDQMAYVAYLVFGLILTFVVIFVIKNLFSSSGSLKSTLIGAGSFAAVLLISYMVSGGDTTAYFDQGVQVSDGNSQMVGAGITAFYILGIVAIGTILFSGIKKMIK